MASILYGSAEILQSLPVLVPKFAQFLAFGIGSVACAELTRDVYHILCHIWPPLMRLHGIHHRVFKKDLSAVSKKLYQQSQWWHDVPEACLMFLSTLVFFTIAYLFI